MNQHLQRCISAFFRSLGYQISKIPPTGHRSEAFATQHRLAAALDRPQPTIFDVGANIGDITQSYRTLFPAADIYCFEPFPDSAAALNRRFAHDPKVHVAPQAVAQTDGPSTFYLNQYHPTHSLLPRPNSARRYYPKHAGPKATTEVQTVTLDTFTTDNHLALIDILKLDIQGGELMALRGARNLLQNQAISLIFTEVAFVPHYENSPLFHDLSSFLTQFGYTLFAIYNMWQAQNGQLRFCDALFVSESVRTAVIDQCPEEP